MTKKYFSITKRLFGNFRSTLYILGYPKTIATVMLPAQKGDSAIGATRALTESKARIILIKQ